MPVYSHSSRDYHPVVNQCPILRQAKDSEHRNPVYLEGFTKNVDQYIGLFLYCIFLPIQKEANVLVYKECTYQQKEFFVEQFSTQGILITCLVNLRDEI